MHPDQDVDPPPRSSRGLILVLAIVAGVLLFVSLVRRREAAEGNVPAAIGKQLGNVKLEPLLNADQSLDLDSLHGKVTLVNLWGPWCGPCLMELPELVKLEQKYRGRDDIQILLVAFPQSHEEETEDLRAASQQVLRRFADGPAIYHDPALSFPGLVDTVAGRSGFPTTVVLDRSGVIQAMWIGYDAQFVQQMGPAIEKALSEK